MRPHFYVDQLTPDDREAIRRHLTPHDRQTIRRYYGWVATFYCCVVLITVAVATLTAGDHQANGLGAVAKAAAADGSVVAPGPSTNSALPTAVR